MGAKAALFICTNALVAGGQINVDTLAAVVKNQVALIPIYSGLSQVWCEGNKRFFLKILFDQNELLLAGYDRTYLYEWQGCLGARKIHPDGPTILWKHRLREVARRGLTAYRTALSLTLICCLPASQAFRSVACGWGIAPGQSAAHFVSFPRFAGPRGIVCATLQLRGGGSVTKMAESTIQKTPLRLIDTCVNLQDAMFQGIYNEKQKHEPDWDLVMERAAAVGVFEVIAVSGSLEDSRQSVAAAKDKNSIFASVGVHPTRCNEFEESGDAEAHLEALRALVVEAGDRIVAIGEIGLDYDREQFCGRDVQVSVFVLLY